MTQLTGTLLAIESSFRFAGVTSMGCHGYCAVPRVVAGPIEDREIPLARAREPIERQEPMLDGCAHLSSPPSPIPSVVSDQPQRPRTWP